MADTDAAGLDTNPASAPQPASLSDKDRVGEELSDDARIWRVYDQVARVDDRERINTWNRGLDNLALFAGLFSAVTTAFIIEAQKDMKVDYSQLAFLALNASANGVPFVQQPFVVPSSARTITCLWVASLILSLSAALIAIMGKDWIGMYAARPVCNPRQWAEIRTHRLLCVERWYMSGVIASAPVLLHVSLLLFGAGLVLFISSDPLTHHLTIGLSLAAGGLYLVTALSAVAFPASPFKSPATKMIQGALAAAFQSLHDILLYRPKRNLVATVHAAISHILVPDLNEISNRQPRILPDEIRTFRGTNPLHRPGLLHISPIQIAQSTVRRALDVARTFPASLRTVWVTSCLALGRASGHMRPTNIVSVVRRLRVDRFFRGSGSWTNPRLHRSPEHLANALSWLHSASLEPEVLRAIIVALGDLEIGAEVARLVCVDLHTRIRADIRFNWQKVDFFTLSRYVLADRNLPAQPLISYVQFRNRFDMEREPHLRCEDGLAAVVLVDKGDVLASDIQRYRPHVVSQPRMFHWLLPHVSGSRTGYEPLLNLINYYRKSLSRREMRGLEATFLQCFHPLMREDYQRIVRTKFGNQYGLLELLVYLIVEPRCLENDLATTAMDLVVHILTHFEHIDGEHWCVAYLFSSGRSASLWAERGLTWVEARSLLDSLPLWTYCQYKWDDKDTPPDPERYQPMEPEIARTVIEILSPQRRDGARDLADDTYRSMGIVYGDMCARFLHVQLCHSHSLLADDDKTTLIGLLLEKAALLWIRVVRLRRYCRPDYPHRPECCIDILTAIVHHLTRYLQSEINQSRGVELFGLFAHSETQRRDGSLVTWDVGDYLRKMLAWTSYESSIAGAIRRLFVELQAFYPLCHDSAALLPHWNRIGLPAVVDGWKYETDDDLAAFFSTRIQEVNSEPESGGFGLLGAAGDEPEQGDVELSLAGDEQAAVRPAGPEIVGGDEVDAICRLYVSMI